KIIIDFCADGGAYTPTNVPTTGPDINDGLERIGKPPGVVYADYTPEIPPGDIEDFVDDVPERLTPDQLCSLLNGRPSKTTLEIVNDLLEEPKYSALRNVLKNDDDIVNFLLYIAAILGSITIDEICGINDVPVDDICSVDDAIENVQRLVFEM